jgi:HSP20 family protein
MDRDFPWMWSEACAMLVRAERLHREFFRPTGSLSALPVWEPPVDILETEHDVLVLVALPGISPDRVEATIEEGHLIIQGVRVLPAELRTAEIHRLELPQGRFERRVRLPAGRYRDVRRSAVDGCLVITLSKMEPIRG